MDPVNHLADYTFLLHQMAQPPNQHVDSRDPKQTVYHTSPRPLPHQQHLQQPSGHAQYNPPTRAGPLRLDLPPQPVFAAPSLISPNVEYPNQYGPPTGFTSYQTGPPLLSPNYIPPPGHPSSSSELYLPADFNDGQQNTGRMYPVSLPTSPYGAPNPPPWQQQQQQQQVDFTNYNSQPPQLSPYYTPYNQPVISASSTGSNNSNQMQDYFPPYAQIPESQQHNSGQVHPQQLRQQPLTSPPLISPPWQSPHLVTPVTASRPGPQPLSGGGSSQSGGSGGQGHHIGGHGNGHSHGPKTSRQQFTACGACRHRRVKCDLKVRQDEVEQRAAEEKEMGTGVVRTNTAARKQKVKCTNCQERGMNCV